MTMIADLYRRWLFEVWGGDLAVTGEIFTPDAVGHWPGEDAQGPGGIAAKVGEGLAAFNEVDTTLDVGPIVDGDLVAARWTFHGVYQGGIPGATAVPGTEIAFSGQDILRVDDGRFAEYWVVSDAFGLMAQLGALSGTP